MSSTPAAVEALDSTTTPVRAFELYPTNERNPPVPPECQAHPRRMTHAKPISAFVLPKGRRTSSIAFMAGARGDSLYPRNAARNVSMSLAEERSAPAPASTDKFQLRTGARAGL